MEVEITSLDGSVGEDAQRATAVRDEVSRPQSAVRLVDPLANDRPGQNADGTLGVLDQTTVGGLVERYDRVAGMTGTAVAVAEELREFHALEVTVVAPHRP